MIKKLCIVLFVLLALNVQAQEGTSSPYSFYGIGSLKFKGTAEARSMGGIGIFSDSIHVNLRNPASYGGKNLKSFNEEGRLVKFALGGSHATSNLQTDEASDRTNASTFDYIAISFPVNKLGFGFGVVPYSSVGYRLESLGMIGDTILTTNRYRGEGGVNRVYFGVGYEIANNLRIGAEANYNFGNIKNSSIEFVFDDEGDPLQYQSRESNRSDLSGLNFNIGLIYSPMVTDKLQLTTAFTYAPKSDLTSKNERTFATIVINPLNGQEFPVNEIESDLESLGLRETKLTLPAKTSFGAGIGEPRKWFFGGEYTFLQTSQFANGIFDIENASFEDASSIAFGGFIVPEYTSFNSYWRRVVYRAGIRFENTGLKINNESINEFGISFGVGLPVGTLFSNANLGVEVGKRGTTNQNLVQENFVNFQLSLSLNDRWFVKRKFN